MSKLSIDNTTIKTDSEGRFCLNDLHKAAGGEPKHRPGEWLKTGPTSELITEIESANVIAVSTVVGRTLGYCGVTPHKRVPSQEHPRALQPTAAHRAAPSRLPIIGKRNYPSNSASPVRERADAMWWAESYDDHKTPPDITHPTNLRVWFNEQKQHTALLPADLSDIEAESIETIVLDERSAERIAKVIHRLPAGAGYMKGTPSPWSPRAKTSFI